MTYKRRRVAAVIVVALTGAAGQATSDAATRSRTVQKKYVVDFTKPMVPFTGTGPENKSGVACSYRGPGTQCMTFPSQPREGAVTVRLSEDSGTPVAFALLADWNGDGKVADNEVFQFCETGGVPLAIRTKPTQVNVAFGGKVPYEITGKTRCGSGIAQKGTVKVTFLR